MNNKILSYDLYLYKRHDTHVTVSAVGGDSCFLCHEHRGLRILGGFRQGNKSQTLGSRLTAPVCGLDRARHLTYRRFIHRDNKFICKKIHKEHPRKPTLFFLYQLTALMRVSDAAAASSWLMYSVTRADTWQHKHKKKRMMICGEISTFSMYSVNRADTWQHKHKNMDGDYVVKFQHPTCTVSRNRQHKHKNKDDTRWSCHILLTHIHCSLGRYQATQTYIHKKKYNPSTINHGLFFFIFFVLTLWPQIKHVCDI